MRSIVAGVPPAKPLGPEPIVSLGLLSLIVWSSIAWACAAETMQPTMPTSSASPSSSADSSKAAQIITAFGQGNAGNCASISVIKLALFTYGYESTFAKVANDSKAFTLRDGKIVLITADDLRQIEAVAGFIGVSDATVTDQATRMLTIMARNKCAATRGCTSILDAFDAHDHFLDESTEGNLKWLGIQNAFENHTPPGDIRTFDRLGAYVVTNQKHSAFGFAGQYDEKGELTPIGKFEERHSSSWTRFWGLRHLNGLFLART